jgi:transcriptional regulator with XRE-family HTH domain
MGLSQQELASTAGVARITIANVELGKHSGIRPSTAFKLAQALQITPQELLGEELSLEAKAPADAVERTLQEYESLKKGTIVEPTATERRWLRQMLAAWGEEFPATSASVLFLLLARRHGKST